MDFGWIWSGLLAAAQPYNLLVALVGCFFGTLVGVLPGFGPAAALALLFPFTASLTPAAAMIGLGAIYYGAMYGGSTTAILLNIPGEVASVPTAIEGYPLMKKGRGGPALVIAAVVSFMGGTIALVMLTFFAPALADLALTFGPYEYLGLVVFSLACAAGLSGASVARGLAAASLGLVFDMVGNDPASSGYRLTFGAETLYAGFDVVPIVVGLFGVGEVLNGLSENMRGVMVAKLDGLMPSAREWVLGLWAGLRGSLLAAPLGILPGIAPSVTSFLSYFLEKRVGKERDRFGQGAIEGVAGPEAANNAAAVSGFIPLLALGLPTNPVLAIVLAAIQIQGVAPGPMLFITNMDLVATVIGSFFIGNLILVILNIPLVGIWVRIAMVPYRMLAPIIIVLCALGTYSLRNSLFDLWVMIGFGLFGFMAKKTSFPLAPFVLGLILGSRLEISFRQVMTVGPAGILNRPVALASLVLAVAAVALFTVYRGKSAGLGEEVA